MSKLVPVSVGTMLGGVRIIAVLNTASNANEHLYHVQHLCCGLEVEMNHALLRKRARMGLSRCGHCGKAVGGGKSAKSHVGIQIIDELPARMRKKVPSAAEVLDLWNRANARVAARVGARG